MSSSLDGFDEEAVVVAGGMISLTSLLPLALLFTSLVPADIMIWFWRRVSPDEKTNSCAMKIVSGRN